MLGGNLTILITFIRPKGLKIEPLFHVQHMELWFPAHCLDKTHSTHCYLHSFQPSQTFSDLIFVFLTSPYSALCVDCSLPVFLVSWLDFWTITILFIIINNEYVFNVMQTFTFKLVCVAYWYRLFILKIRV